jgi:hypothetical protein
MSHSILPYGIAITLAGAWGLLVFRPVLHCVFGSVVPLNPFKRPKLELAPRDEAALVGFFFAATMVIFDLTLRYSRWWLCGNASDRPGIEQIVDIVFSDLLAGCLFGLVSIASNRRKRRSG